MKIRGNLLLVALVSVCILTVVASAHIPIAPDDSTTLATATEIIDPWKSWFYYTELSTGEAHYYRFDASEGERIRFMLNLPLEEGDRGFNPIFIFMGPGVTDIGSPPVTIEVPPGAGVMVIEPSTLEPEFEGFTPISQYMTVDLNMSAPETGTYYIAVYDETGGGRYALVSGYVEAYTLIGWIMVPLDVFIILQWTGQNLLFIIMPYFVPLVLGVIFLLWKHRSAFSKERLASLLGTLGGLMFLGSSLAFGSQTIYALTRAPPNWTVWMSVIFTVVPLLLGLLAMMIVHKENWYQHKIKLLSLMVIGIIAPFVWAGLFIGPILVIIAGLLPFFKKQTI